MHTPPTSAGDVLGAAGSPLHVTYLDRQHPVSPPTLRVLDRIEKLVALRAAVAVNDLVGVLPAADAAELRAGLMSDLKARQHATGGRLWAAEMEADGGQRGLCLILFACLEEAREAADKATLPPAVPFDDMLMLLAESPDAAAVGAMLLPDFTRAVGARRRLPPTAMAKMEATLAATATPPTSP